MSHADPHETNPPGAGLAAFAARLAALWILAGAAFKLLQGTPADLPPIVRDLPADFGIELGLTYKLAIAVELVVAFTVLLRPRWGWLPLVLVFVVFELVLATMLGEESCGCFGSSVTLSPEMMMAIDGVLLAFVLVTRPWSRLRRGGPNIVLIAGAAAVGIALPWLLDRQVGRTGPAGSTGEAGDGSTVVVDGEEIDEGGWMQLDIESWVGQDIWDTPIAEYVDVTQLPLDGLWVLYRHTCDHCAVHLEELAQTELGDRLVTLLRLKEAHDTEANRVVFTMPEGGFVQYAEMPDSITYIITTPGEMVLEGGRIVSAREGASND